MKNTTLTPPPPDNSAVAPIIAHVQRLYQELYITSGKIPKRDKLGLHLEIEKICTTLLSLCIKASLSKAEQKTDVIKEIRILVETIKYLIRVSYELSIIDQKKYIALETKLQEISRMATGWGKYITNNLPIRRLL